MVKFYLESKLGQRGAEMVEYAIVLACIAAVGVAFYSYSNAASGEGATTLKSVLQSLWGQVSTAAGQAK